MGIYNLWNRKSLRQNVTGLLKYCYIIDSIGNSGPKQLRLLPRPQHPRRRQCLLV